MPVHCMMVSLTGREVRRGGVEMPSDDAKMADVMRTARDELRRHCGVDFGANLAAWRAYLMSPEGKPKGYRHPYSHDTVDKIVIAAITDTRRRRIAELIDREGT
jgi:hypothetical protein